MKRSANDEESPSSSSMDGQERSKKMKPSEEILSVTSARTRLCTYWAFTTTTESSVRKEDEDVIVWIGPNEDRGGAHGLLYWKCGESASTRKLKKQTVEKLKKLGIQGITYVAAAKKRTEYVMYMYKTLDDGIPQSTKEELTSLKILKVGSYNLQEKLLQLRETFVDKPTYNVWAQAAYEQIGYDVNEQTVRRVFASWESNFGSLQSIISGIEKEKLNLSLSSAMNALKYIGQNISHFKWNGTSFPPMKAVAFMCWMGLRQRGNVLQRMPHVILKGQAGTGKTLLCNLILCTHQTSNVPMDAEGVGMFAQSGTENVFKIDDAPAAAFINPRIIATAFSMFENKWESKVHGSKMTHDEARMVITTNEEAIEQMVCLNYDRKAYIRRFAEITFRRTVDLPRLDGTIISEELRNNVLLNILHWANNSLENCDFWEDELETYFLMRDESIDCSVMRDHELDYGQDTMGNEITFVSTSTLNRLRVAFEKRYPSNFMLGYYLEKEKGFAIEGDEWKEVMQWVSRRTRSLANEKTKVHVTTDGLIMCLDHDTAGIEKLDISKL